MLTLERRCVELANCFNFGKFSFWLRKSSPADEEGEEDASLLSLATAGLAIAVKAAAAAAMAAITCRHPNNLPLKSKDARENQKSTTSRREAVYVGEEISRS